MVKNLKKLYNRMEQNEYQELYEKTQNNHSFVFSRDLEGNTLLHYATLEGNFDAVKRLMELGSCATICNEQGYTPLVNAVYCENTALLSYLIENSRVSLLREDEEMLLVHAATAGIYESLKCMLDMGFSYNFKEGTPLLHWAMQSSNINIVELLCEKGVNINDTNEEGMTALYDASANGLTDIVMLLVKNGANIEQASYNGVTPLIIASIYEHIDSVKILIENGANLETRDEDGKSALLYAVEYGNLDIVKELLARESDICIKDNKGRSIQMYIKKIKKRI